jgi:hypothetical protein
MFADTLQPIGRWIMWVWRTLKTRPSVDTIVDERLSDIPVEHVARIKRRLQEYREQRAPEEA